MIQKIPLGNTDAMVSELSLGAMYFGSKMDEKASTEVLESYVGHGGSFIDTAAATISNDPDRPNAIQCVPKWS